MIMPVIRCFVFPTLTLLSVVFSYVYVHLYSMVVSSLEFSYFPVLSSYIEFIEQDRLGWFLLHFIRSMLAIDRSLVLEYVVSFALLVLSAGNLVSSFIDTPF